jgi:hypothetical protein
MYHITAKTDAEAKVNPALQAGFRFPIAEPTLSVA